jgi:hypothetical protein
MNRTANKASRLPIGVGCPSAPPPSPNGPNGDTLPASAPATDGRDPASGRFLPGWKGGPGNPFARRTAKLRSALLDAVDEDRLKRVVAKVVDMAEGGDLAAAKLLLSYTVGRPAPAVDPDALDLQELRMLAEGPNIEQVLGLVKRVAAGYAAQYVRGVQPADWEGLRKLFEESLRSLRSMLGDLDDLDLDDED